LVALGMLARGIDALFASLILVIISIDMTCDLNCNNEWFFYGI
jgi:hypothetical protein